jgi:hypothetical protein
MSREIGLAGIKLASFVGAHNLAGVSNRGRLVEALAECVAYEGVWRHVVAPHARMDVSNELAPLGWVCTTARRLTQRACTARRR